MFIVVIFLTWEISGNVFFKFLETQLEISELRTHNPSYMYNLIKNYTPQQQQQE